MTKFLLILLIMGASLNTLAEGASKQSWQRKIIENGLTCEDDPDGSGKIWPDIHSQRGYFVCPCTTDMGCIVSNPHIPVNGLRSSVIATWPRGTSCDNSIKWNEAGSHIGKTLIVTGPVVKITKPSSVRGNPTWIDIGTSFPDTGRLTLVLWEDQEKNFQFITDNLSQGSYICVLGKIYSHKGVSQIELKKPESALLESGF